MNKESIPVKYCATPEEADEHGDGALTCDDEVLSGEDDPTMFIYLRGPAGIDFGAIQVSRGAHTGKRIWKIEGDPRKIETLTLSPSLHLLKEWHGFLRNGRLVSC